MFMFLAWMREMFQFDFHSKVNTCLKFWYGMVKKFKKLFKVEKIL